MITWVQNKMAERRETKRVVALAEQGLSPDNFPLLIKNHWYCGSWYMYRGDCHKEQRPRCRVEGCDMSPLAGCHDKPYAGWDLIPETAHCHRYDGPALVFEWPIEGKAMFNPFECRRDNIRVQGDSAGLVDDLIPAYRLGDLVGLYDVDGWHLQPGDDRAMWDNGIEIDLAFQRTVPVATVPSLSQDASS